MNVARETTLRRIQQKEFHILDYQVMRIAFALHNKMGRLWDEDVYKREMANRLKAEGVGHADVEVPIQIGYKDFKKTNFMDIVVNESAVYELKAVKRLTGAHQKQLLQYLMLANVAHGKLINFRPPSVEHRFVSTRLTTQDRLRHTVHDETWHDVDASSRKFKDLITNLVASWGMFLDAQLLCEAVVHFLGGEERVLRAVEVVDGIQAIGSQRMHLLNNATAFRITAVTTGVDLFHEHLSRQLIHTSLEALAWVNLNHHRLEFRTLLKA